MFLSALIYCYLCSSLRFGEAVLSAGSSYVAAVYEHRVFLNPEPRVPLSRCDALKHVQKNLDIYEEQAARAAKQVKIIYSRLSQI